MDYGYLREQYPAVISKDQLYRICHISKRKALWLLEHGVIPCEDSGKQTRRFRIQMEDVIDFLERRDTGELDGVLPDGIVDGFLVVFGAVCKEKLRLVSAVVQNASSQDPDVFCVDGADAGVDHSTLVDKQGLTALQGDLSRVMDTGSEIEKVLLL